MKWPWLGVLFCLFLAACAQPVRVSPPIIADTWQHPDGVPSDPPLSREQLRSLFAYDAQAPLDMREEKRGREPGLTVIYFSYASPSGGRVPAVLVVPDGPGLFAGLVMMHGSGGSRSDLLVLAKSYARLGVVTMTISAPSARPEHNSLDAFLFTEQDRREQIQLIVDLRRAVDVLVSRPRVDPERLAYLGVSYGGAMGGLLAAVETRLKGYVLMVGDGGLVHHFSGPRVMGLPAGKRLAWLAAMWPIEPIRYVGYAAPAALLFQNGTRDTQVPPALAILYQKAGSEPKTVLWYETSHNLFEGLQASRDHLAWLRTAIGVSSYRMAFPFGVKISLIAWLFLTVASLVVVARHMWLAPKPPQGAPPLGARILWLLTTVTLGPLGLAAYWIAGSSTSRVRRAVGSAAWAGSGALVGLILSLALAQVFPLAFRDTVGFVVIGLVVIVTSWGIFAAARMISRRDARFSASYRRPLLTEIPSALLILAGAIPTWIALNRGPFNAWTAGFGFDASYAPLWGGLILAAVAGMLVTYPLHLLLVHTRVIRWNDPQAA
jgi:dienelactone hydrolase